uniref:Uncharacterized protein n=1 Tax=Romanomermis culicivorax TaxID=13658 RepID=A0A915KJ44_ROMCU
MKNLPSKQSLLDAGLLSGVLYTAKRFDHTNVTEIVLVISASNLRSNTSMLLNAKILKFVKSSAARTTTTTTSSPLFLQTEIHQVKNSNFGRQDNGDDIRILNEDPVRFQITDLPAYFYVGQILAENNEHGS